MHGASLTFKQQRKSLENTHIHIYRYTTTTEETNANQELWSDDSFWKTHCKIGDVFSYIILPENY